MQCSNCLRYYGISAHNGIGAITVTQCPFVQYLRILLRIFLKEDFSGIAPNLLHSNRLFYYSANN